VGAAEGERAIAQATLYCAAAAKINEVYTAFKAAVKDAKDLPDYPVPDYLRNAPTQLAKQMGHGEGYRYAHNESGAYAAGEVYLPKALHNTQYYHPSEQGLEKKIAEKLAYLRQQDQLSNNKRYSV
jgi:putative ATPase